jgi:hypothetical protein
MTANILARLACKDAMAGSILACIACCADVKSPKSNVGSSV